MHTWQWFKYKSGINVNWDNIDRRQFELGMMVELEHGSKNPEIDVTHNNQIETAKIVLAHLLEVPDYYTKLKKVEENKLSLMFIYKKLK